MLGYSRRPVLAAHAASWAAVRGGALGVLPLARACAPHGVDRKVLADLTADWADLLGAGRVVAVHPQRQQDRPGFVVLVTRPGQAPALVKCRREKADLAVEERVLQLVGAARAVAFVTPRVVASGRTSGWSWLAVTAMPPRPHRPLSLRSSGRISRVLRDVARVLDPLPRPEGVPSSWLPAHNDLAPWNLRRVAGRTWLLDWETAAFAPPQADHLYLRATYGALGYRLPELDVPIPDETAVWWRERLRRRAASGVDAALTAELLRRAEHLAGATAPR